MGGVIDLEEEIKKYEEEIARKDNEEPEAGPTIDYEN